jgi:squamous cell carcinoma antigen recognized by T-cells 3
MAEAPARTPPPRSFTSNSLSEAELQTVTDLLSYLRDNSYAYEQHVQLINLLHKGFVAHVYPPVDSDETTPGDPQAYGLLSELRQAREAMDTRFAVGEDIWADWLADETLTAKTGEERLTLTELYQKAVADEPASVKLWSAYVDFVQSSYAACHNLEGADRSGWTDEDRELYKDLYTREMLAGVLADAVEATKWRLDESHVLWNRYIELIQQSLPNPAPPAEISRLHDFFFQRLQIPHAASAETAQLFWPIVNKYQPENWEAIMAQVNELAAPARQQVALREEHELAVERASAAGDQEALFNAFSAYLQWEQKHKGRGSFSYELRCALYERALLRFPTYTDWWIDCIDLKTSNSSASTSLLPLMERATRHCPWSGDLWGKRILRSAVENKAHFDIEHTKHRATNSGLLDVGGMEELLKVLQQWCSYLRRHAFAPGSTEDDQDTAEVGIVQALEDIQRAGEAVYGPDFKGDPLYRLETIQIKFLTEARRPVDAREIYKRLVPVHKDSYDFWNKYYHWELLLWSYERLNEARRVETVENGPHLATAVVKEGLSQRNLDSPEKMLDLYLNHFQQHESAEKLQSALIEARELSKRLAFRRAKEAEAAALEAAQTTVTASETAAPAATREKRKAEEVLTNGERIKKPRGEEAPAAGAVEPSSSVSAQAKRDREHNTITVRNLPSDVSETDVKKFFRDVGKPLSINIMKDKESDLSIATVEFESHEDVLAAKTRNGKELNGFEVRIHSGGQNTLYVTNYPPEYDEAAIRKLFESYGDIVSVRFPSLKFDNRRRFCYVQFLAHEMARAAEAAMDNKKLDGLHTLLAKISNPDAKKQRSGAQAEGKEIIAKNVHFLAPESEIKEFLGQYGTIISMNVMKLVNGRRTGAVFVVYSTPEEAQAALAADNKPFRDRILQVEMAAPRAAGRHAPLERARKQDIIVKGAAASASPGPEGANGRRGSDASMKDASYEKDESFRTARERKIAVFNLPDTVNDVRIRAAMEKYGPILKIQLRREHNGAIVEFVNIKDAFNVRQGVDVSSLGPEVKTGDVADFFGKKTSASKMMVPPSVSRASQRGGRRGGLGFKRGGVGFTPSRLTIEGSGNAGNAEGGRSNSDFRAMFEAGKPAPKPDGDGTS